MPKRRGKYDWFRTWDDKPETYVCNDGEMKVGRVYRISSMTEGGWFWACPRCSQPMWLKQPAGREPG